MQDLLVGFTSLTRQMGIMYLIGLTLIRLAIKKEYEPMLLLPIGFGAILVNLPLATVWEIEGTVGLAGSLLRSPFSSFSSSFR